MNEPYYLVESSHDQMEFVFTNKGDVSDFLFENLELYKLGAYRITRCQPANNEFPIPIEFETHRRDMEKLDELPADSAAWERVLERAGIFEGRAVF